MVKIWSYYLTLIILVYLLGLGFESLVLEKQDWFYVDENIKLQNIIPSEHEIEFFDFGFPFTGKSYTGFKQAIAKKESQGKYNLVNSYGYVGKYQFGIRTLRAIGVDNIALFLNNPEMQEKAFNVYLSRNKWELRKEINKYQGVKINGISITESGILAAAHLGGARSVKIFLKSKGKIISRDSFGTSIGNYMEKFGGYDTSKIIANPKAKVVMLK